MSAGLGLDLSEFQRGMQQATEVARSNSQLMSAEMKRTAREGSESFRLIDEALGIRVSRPLTRIITQEFPAFAAGLQAVLGGAVVGAIASVGIDAIEKLSEHLKKAGEAQEKWAEASHKSQEVFSDALAEIQKKLAEVNGQSASFKFNTEGAELARRAIDAVGEALKNEAKAAEEAASLTTRAWNGVGSFLSNLALGGALALPDALGGNLSLKLLKDNEQAKNLATALQVMKENLDDALRADAAAGTHEALTVIDADIQRVQVNLHKMEQAGNEAGIALAENAQRFLAESKQLEEATQKLAKAQIAKDYSEQLEKAGQAFEKLLKEIESGTNRIIPQTDPVAKLQTEIAGLKIAAENDFRDIQESAASAFDVKVALSRLQEFEKKLDQTAAKAKQQAEDAKAASLTFAPTSTAPNFPATIPSPVLQLAAPLSDQAELLKIQTDTNEAWKKAGEILQGTETPMQKYDAGLAILQTLTDKGRITSEQFVLAQQKLQEQLAESTNKLEELLKKTGDASAGIQAFFIQLNKDANQNGAFAFDFLNKGLDGFENATVRALTGGKNEWRKYFQELDQMALKFALNKLLAGGLLEGKGLLGGLFGGGQQGQNTTGQNPGAIPSPLNLPKEAFGALPSFLGGGGGTASLASAGTSLTTAGTLLSSAAASLQAAGASLSTGIAGGGAPGFNPLSFTSLIPHAGGGDLTPGLDYLVGEQGPEPLHVDSSGSAFISPHSSLRESDSGKTTHIHNYDLRGADPATVQKLIAALPLIEERAVARAVNASSEISRRTANPS